MTRDVLTRGPRGTQRVAGALAAACAAAFSGARVGLRGEMGAGKTTFVRGFVAALPGGRRAAVSSPTWSLANVYASRPPVVHVDAWRLESAADADSIGLDDRDPAAILIVEWWDRLGIDIDVEVMLEPRGPLARRVTIAAHTPRGEAILAALNVSGPDRTAAR